MIYGCRRAAYKAQAKLAGFCPTGDALACLTGYVVSSESEART
jgi:hypothetical protein